MAHCRFIMVPLDPSLGKVTAITQPEEIRNEKVFGKGLERYKKRKELRKIQQAKPSEEELKNLEDLFTRFNEHKPISQTVLKTYEVMHSQDRNSYHKMFGGFLIKKAIDVATSCVRLFA